MMEVRRWKSEKECLNVLLIRFRIRSGMTGVEKNKCANVWLIEGLIVLGSYFVVPNKIYPPLAEALVRLGVLRQAQD